MSCYSDIGRRRGTVVVWVEGTWERERAFARVKTVLLFTADGQGERVAGRRFLTAGQRTGSTQCLRCKTWRTDSGRSTADD